VQAYVFAAICLFVGLPIGYFLRGSAQPAPKAAEISVPVGNVAPGMGAASPAPTAPAEAPRQMPTLDDMKCMADKQAAPLLEQLKEHPTDAALLNKIGLTYKAAHQFEEASRYFKASLRNDPKNIAVRDDYASCLYYAGHVEAAVDQLEQSLSYEPNHPGTLFNLGMIKWKGQGDVDGAIAAWEKLLKTNPKFERKDAVQRLIQEAKNSKNHSGNEQKS
jgi:cytochrome c-type biogenesis protein CcmH/NrfG